MSLSQVVVATSIAPRNIEHQKRCIESWMRAGFQVVSVNSEPEISQIKDKFTDVTFFPVYRDASSFANRPLVYFDDVLKALEVSGSLICGIINSDIYLNVSRDFLPYLQKEAQNSFLYGTRIDTNSLCSENGEEYSVGFDYFFFDTAIINSFPTTELCLGLPWWDYWAPLIAMTKGYPVKQLITPVAYHLIHDLNWAQDFCYSFRKYIVDCLSDNSIYEQYPQVSVELKNDPFVVATITRDYLFNHSLKVQYIAEHLRNGEDSTGYMAAEIEFYKKTGDILRRRLLDEVVATARCRNSLCSKIVYPLRQLRRLLGFTLT